MTFGGMYYGVPHKVEVLSFSLSCIFRSFDLVIDSVNVVISLTNPKSAIFRMPFLNKRFSGYLIDKIYLQISMRCIISINFLVAKTKLFKQI